MIRTFNRAAATGVAALTLAGAGVQATVAQAATASSSVTKYATAATNVRSGAGTNYGIVGSLKPGDAVTGVVQGNGWIKISAPAALAGKYVSGAVLTASAPKPTTPPTTTTPPATTQPGSVSVVTRYATGTVNVRSGAGTTYSVVGSLNAGTAVTGAVQSNGWIKISAPASLSGRFVSGNVLSSTAPGASTPTPTAPTSGTVTAWVAADTGVQVNVRTGPAVSYPVKTKYSGRTKVTGVLEGDWIHLPNGYLSKAVVTFSDPHAVNGRIPRDQLCAVPLAYNSVTEFEPGYKPGTVRLLNCTALSHLVDLENAYKQATGHFASIDMAYRDTTEQQYWVNFAKSGKGNPASPVGSSNHGWGLAVDFIETAPKHSEFYYMASGHNWLVANAARYGFGPDPVVTATNGESYHWNFVG